DLGVARVDGRDRRTRQSRRLLDRQMEDGAADDGTLDDAFPQRRVDPSRLRGRPLLPRRGGRTDVVVDGDVRQSILGGAHAMTNRARMPGRVSLTVNSPPLEYRLPCGALAPEGLCGNSSVGRAQPCQG